jgi:hypothetical protein
VPLVNLDEALTFGIPPSTRDRIVHFEAPDGALPVKDDFANVPVESKIGRVGFGHRLDGERRPETLARKRDGHHVIAACTSQADAVWCVLDDAPHEGDHRR